MESFVWHFVFGICRLRPFVWDLSLGILLWIFVWDLSFGIFAKEMRWGSFVGALRLRWLFQIACCFIVLNFRSGYFLCVSFGLFLGRVVLAIFTLRDVGCIFVWDVFVWACSFGIVLRATVVWDLSFEICCLGLYFWDFPRDVCWVDLCLESFV